MNFWDGIRNSTTIFLLAISCFILFAVFAVAQDNAEPSWSNCATSENDENCSKTEKLDARGPGDLSNGTNVLLPTRIFLEPHRIPPDTSYAGYALLAFPSRATSNDYDRHLWICEAFMNALQSTYGVAEPIEQQFVTVWPVSSRSIANHLNQIGKANSPSEDVLSICETAINHYDLTTSQHMIGVARQKEVRLEGKGPFLIAWSPASDFRESGRPVLVLDLSRANDPGVALSLLLDWYTDIQLDYEVLTGGFTMDLLRIKNSPVGG